jgi:hypothetical protein
MLVLALHPACHAEMLPLLAHATTDCALQLSLHKQPKQANEYGIRLTWQAICTYWRLGSEPSWLSSEKVWLALSYARTLHLQTKQARCSQARQC